MCSNVPPFVSRSNDFRPHDKHINGRIRLCIAFDDVVGKIAAWAAPPTRANDLRSGTGHKLPLDPDDRAAAFVLKAA
jgi:hypothetical protein